MASTVPMIYLSCIFTLLIINFLRAVHCDDSEQKVEEYWPQSTIAPSVMVCFMVRNKAHTLPWFLNYLEKIDYPKNRMRLWIRSDHNVDNSVPILREWLSKVQNQYNSVDFVDDNSETSYSDASGPFDWSKKRVTNVIRLRQEALNTARNIWVDYLLSVDVDNFLLNDQILKILIRHNKPVISPILNVTASQHYSNFWGEMDSNGYYQRSENYEDIKERNELGVFQVALVHSTILIEIRNSLTRGLAYDPPPPDYQGPVDDIIIFAHTAQYNKIPLYISNEHSYGMMLMPMESHHTIDQERDQFVHMKMEAIVYDIPFEKLSYIDVPPRISDKLGFGERIIEFFPVYMINLVRRPERKEKMMACFKELGINATVVEAVDGKSLNETYLKFLGVKVISSYADPYDGKRTMTMGEIGCFLSHYFIWLDVLARKLPNAIVFEDDVRFRPFFRDRLKRLMTELKDTELAWDLFYLGRKKLFEDGEPSVSASEELVWPQYSYWTVGYALSYTGAWKLIQQDPLKKMVPVDEYIPIMFDRHPRDDWKTHFNPRNLVAVSSQPLLIEPTLYTGEPGYITDTEDSVTVDRLLSARKRGDTDPLPQTVDEAEGRFASSKTEL